MFDGSLQGCLRVSATMWVSNQSSVASCVVLPEVNFEIFYWSAVEKGKYNTSVSRIKIVFRWVSLNSYIKLWGLLSFLMLPSGGFRMIPKLITAKWAMDRIWPLRPESWGQKGHARTIKLEYNDNSCFSKRGISLLVPSPPQYPKSCTDEQSPMQDTLYITLHTLYINYS